MGAEWPHARLSVIALVFLFTTIGGFFPMTTQPGEAGPGLAVAAMSIPGLPASAPTSSVSSIGAQPVPLTITSPAVSQVAVTPSPSLVAARAAAGSGATALSREREQTPIFYRYEVKVGDTVDGIAKQFGVGRDYITWNNADVQGDSDLVKPGQLLQVPSVEGIIHSVRLGETLTEIADHYDAKVADIIAFPANGLTNPNRLPENGTILVPGGRITPKPAPSLRPDPPALVAGPSAAPAAAPVGWVWPLSGPLTSVFGPAHPLGIDISAPYVPVAAAQGGVVVFAGGDRCCSYGFYVEVQHPGGYSTRYAHLSEIRVSLGQVVNQGQLLGISGNTGYSTGPHLHFEMRRNGQIVNPLSFLP